jgi:drug/metabolite transporter (DMT)-like permease
MAETPARPASIWAALLTVYVVWGSTYLAMRVAVETIPPVLGAGVRFLAAGAILYGIVRARGAPRATAAQWRSAALTGALLLLGGNAMVMWAEQFVPSNFAAIMIATVPLWMVVINQLVNRDEPLRWPTVVGLLLGFVGVAILVWDPAQLRFGGFAVGTGALLFAALSWAAGSVLSRRAPITDPPLLMTGMQMLVGGGMVALVGVAIGETGRIHAVSLRSASALVYLIVFGAILGYSCYLWLLRAAKPSLVATYAYVNPVVAILLGAAILGESITRRTILGSFAILVGVVLIVTLAKPRAAAPPAIPKETPQTGGPSAPGV